MKIFLTDQSNNFERLLSELMVQPVIGFEKHKLKEKTTAIEIRCNKTLDELNLDFLYKYQVFPSDIMTHLTQWEHERRGMQIGDTILQQAFIPPFKKVSQKIIFGVRITKMIAEKDRRGFSYETLVGHVEKGESTFTVENSETGLKFQIRTFSEPGNFITRALGPIISVPYQAHCTRKAL